MKPIFLSLIAPAAVFGAMVLPVAANAKAPNPYGVNARLHRQQERIAFGIANGRLTPGEAVRLERREAAIRRQENYLRFTGGRLTHKERARLEREENRQSFAIWRQKHDSQRGF